MGSCDKQLSSVDYDLCVHHHQDYNSVLKADQNSFSVSWPKLAKVAVSVQFKFRPKVSLKHLVWFRFLPKLCYA